MPRRPSNWLVLAALGAALALPGVGFAQAVEEPGTTVGRALQQPFRDLNIVRPHTDVVLEQALANPYDSTGLDDCVAVSSRISELESLLGPDITTPRKSDSSVATAVAAGAVSSVVDLPFSGIVRRLTGAYAEDMAHRRAVLAGMVRRGYLNGIWRTMGCDGKQVADTADARTPIKVEVAGRVDAPPAAPVEVIEPVRPTIVDSPLAMPSPPPPLPPVPSAVFVDVENTVS